MGGDLRYMSDLDVGTIVMLAVGFLLTAILTPIGMDQIVGANTTGWATSVKTMFSTLLPILYVIGVAILYIPGGAERRKRG